MADRYLFQQRNPELPGAIISIPARQNDLQLLKGKPSSSYDVLEQTKILNFELDGNEPSYVDMPIWHTHNITNIGDEDLYTIFWISEFYDPADPDTFFEKV